jgi:hypothetical protein
LRRRTGAAWFHFVGLTLKLALWAAASQNPELFTVANRYAVSTAARHEKSGAFAAALRNILRAEERRGGSAGAHRAASGGWAAPLAAAVKANMQWRTMRGAKAKDGWAVPQL